MPAMSNLWPSFLAQKMKIVLIFLGKVVVVADRGPAFYSSRLHTEQGEISPDVRCAQCQGNDMKSTSLGFFSSLMKCVSFGSENKTG